MGWEVRFKCLRLEVSSYCVARRDLEGLRKQM